MQAPRIGVFGHYGQENLGDEAIILACVQQIQRQFPSAELTLFSAKPQDSQRRYSLPAFAIRRGTEREAMPSQQLSRERDLAVDHTGRVAREASRERSRGARWKETIKRIPVLAPLVRHIKEWPGKAVDLIEEIAFLGRARRRLRPLDLLIIAGSNQFLDNFGGPWGFPYTLLKWTWLARSVGVPVAYVSVGAGPLEAPLSHRMIRAAVRRASYLSFRDAASRALVDPHNRLNGAVFPDLAFAVASPAAPRSPRPSEATVVAVNPMAVYDARYWYIKDADRYRRYMLTMADLVARLLEAGYAPRLFATQPKDENVIRDIMEALSARALAEDTVAKLPQPLRGVNELLAFLEDVDIVVPTRFHGTVLALWAGKPTVGVCYYRKGADVLREFGQDRFAFDLDTATSERLLEAVNEAAADAESIAQRIRARRGEYRVLIEQQFQTVIAATCRPVTGTDTRSHV